MLIAHRANEILSKKTKLEKLVILELVIIILLCIQAVGPKFKYTIPAIQMAATNEAEIGTIGDDGVYSLTLDQQCDPVTILKSDVIAMQPGAYNVTVNYRSQVNYDERASFDHGTGYLTATSKNRVTNVDFVDLMLRDGRQIVRQSLFVEMPFTVDDIAFSVIFTGEGTLSIQSIEIEENISYRILRILLLMTCFLVLDGIVYVLFYSNINLAKRKNILGLIAIVIFSSLLAFSKYYLPGHDGFFHIERFIALAEEIRQGNWNPYIYSSMLNGYGYAGPVFYCHFFLYLPALLYLGGLPAAVCYHIYVIVLNVITTAVMYHCAHTIADDDTVAVVGTALYVCSAYRLHCIYTRTAVGEYTAMTFMPLVALGMYLIYTAEDGQKISLRSYSKLSLGLTGIILSHVLSTEIVGLFIIAFCVAFIGKTLKPNRLFALCKAAALSILLSAFYIVPFISSMQMDTEVLDRVNFISGKTEELFQLLAIYPVGYEDKWDAAIGAPIILGILIFSVC